MNNIVLSGVLCVLARSVAAQDVVLGHTEHGYRLETLKTLVAHFNGSQKGRDAVQLRHLPADDVGHSPSMALLNADDKKTYFASATGFRPLFQVMKESGQKLDSGSFYPQIAGAVAEKSRQLQALPLGYSLPVLYRNKDLFRKAGLEPDAVPRTWHDVLVAAGKLNDAGVACPLTSSRFAWVHLENVTLQQGQAVVAKSNRVALNGLINIKHIAMLASWYRSNYFRYYGPRNEADVRFLNGECAMLAGESALFGVILAQGKFSAGVGAIPVYEDEYGVMPGNVVPDGAALWVLADKKKEEYKVIARFVAFMMQPDNQRAWVKGTGYLPMTAKAMTAFRESGAPSVVVDTAVRRLGKAMDKGQIKSSSLRTRVRSNVNEQIELVWSDRVSAKQALDTAIAQVNSTK